MDLMHILLGLFLWLVYSVWIALQEHPRDGATFWAALFRALGRMSFLRFDDAPGTLHFPGRAQPMPVPVPECAPPTAPPATAQELASAQTIHRPIGSGPLGVVVLLFLAGALVACGPSLLDLQRQDFAAACKVQSGALRDFAAYDARHELDLVHQAGTREAAIRALAAYRDQRRAVDVAAKDAALAVDAAADVLLLNTTDTERGEAIATAQTKAEALRQAVLRIAGVN